MAQIEVRNVYKIFGVNPKKILPMVKEGATKEQILDQTGHTVGLDNVSSKIEEIRNRAVQNEQDSLDFMNQMEMEIDEEQIDTFF